MGCIYGERAKEYDHKGMGSVCSLVWPGRACRARNDVTCSRVMAMGQDRYLWVADRIVGIRHRTSSAIHLVGGN